MLVKSAPGVDFNHMFTQSFNECSSQKHKRHSSHQCLFALLGSAREEKAARKTLMKLIPDED